MLQQHTCIVASTVHHRYPTKLRHIRPTTELCLQLSATFFHQCLLSFLDAYATPTSPTRTSRPNVLTKEALTATTPKVLKVHLLAQPATSSRKVTGTLGQNQRRNKNILTRKPYDAEAFYYINGLRGPSATGHFIYRHQC